MREPLTWASSFPPVEYCTTFLAFLCSSKSLLLTPCSCIQPPAWCSWGCCSNSIHGEHSPRSYSDWDMSQLKSFAGFLLVYDAVPSHLQFLACPKLTHDDAVHSTSTVQMVQEPLFKATTLAGSFHSQRLRVALGPTAETPLLALHALGCLISNSDLPDDQDTFQLIQKMAKIPDDKFLYQRLGGTCAEEWGSNYYHSPWKFMRVEINIYYWSNVVTELLASSNTGLGFFFRHGDDLIVTPFAQVSTVWWRSGFLTSLKIQCGSNSSCS